MREMFDREQLNKLDKDMLISLFLNLQEQVSAQTSNIEALKAQIERLTEQIALMNSRQFGRSTEKNLSNLNEEQINFFSDILNEAEFHLGNNYVINPDMDTVIIPEHKRKKKAGKRDEDLSAYPVVVIEHVLSEEELESAFPEGYSKLPDEVYKKLELIPASFEVHEHHIAVYKGKNGKLLKANHPKEMLNNSIATPSLVAAIMNGKYTNAVPLYRQEQEFARNDVKISRQVMSNWVISTAERYLSLVYDRLKEELIKTPVVHADETPVLVAKDGRKGMHKNYMWVYRSGALFKDKPVVIYDYQRTRSIEASKHMLSQFTGKLVCDGYQVYHSLENEPDITFEVAGCWVHAKRHFADIVKSLGKGKAAGTLAYEGVCLIDMIYHADKMLKDLKPLERQEKREAIIKPLVDNFFKWCEEGQFKISPNSATANAIKYCLNQEKYLRVFLTDGTIPLDNNSAEQAIRPFCIGKKNWKIIDTVNGANASAIVYSLVETAKANELNIYQYLKLLLTELPKHMDDTSLDFIDKFMPWSEALPDICRKKNTEEKNA